MMTHLHCKRLIWIVALVFATVITVQGQHAAHAAKKLEKEVIAVGYAGGLNYVFGKQMLQGAQDAADEINASGGVFGSKIKIISADSGLTAAGATSAIAKLITSDKVDFLIGGYTSEEATAFQSMAVKNKIVSLLHITTSRFDESYQKNPDKNKYVFAVSTSEMDNATIFLSALPLYTKVLKKELGIEKINVALISDNALWTVNIDKLMIKGIQKNPDVKLVYQTKPARNATDFMAELSEISRKEIHLVIMFGGYGSTVPFVKQFSQMRIPAILTGSIILAMTPDNFIKAVGSENAAFVNVHGFGNKIVSDRCAELVAAFKTKHGWEPGHYAMEGYNQIKVLASGLKKAGTMKNMDVLIPALETVNVPAAEAWGGDLKFNSHRIISTEKEGVLRYIMQYSPNADKTAIIYPVERATSKLMIPDYVIKNWKNR